jgi:putative membrane protein
MKSILKLLLLGGVVYLSAEFLSGIEVDGYKSALIAAVVLALVNFFIKPALQLISLPLTILTLGLFSLVINGLMVMLMDYFVGGFGVKNFWWALLMSIIISIANSIFDRDLKDEKE